MTIGTFLPYVGQALAFMNVKEKMDNDPNVINRPFFLSGRFIGTVMTMVFGGTALGVGMNLEAEIANVTELVNLIYDNNALLGSVGLMLLGVARGVAGYFQRK